MAPCVPGQFAPVSSGALTPFDPAEKLITYDFRNSTFTGGFGAVQEVMLTCQDQHRGSAPDFPYWRRAPIAPSAGPVVLAGVVPFVWPLLGQSGQWEQS